MIKSIRNRLIIIVAAVLMLLIGSVFLIKYSYSKSAILKDEIVELNEKYEYLTNLQKKITDYSSQVKEYRYEAQLFSQMYPPGLFQEDIIILLKKLLESQNIELSQDIVFSEVAPLNREAAKENDKEAQAHDENLIYMNVKTKISTDYSNIKKLMEKIITHQPKITLESVQISYNDQATTVRENPTLDVNLSLNFLAYKDKSIHNNLIEFNDQNGKSNLFMPFDGMSSAGNYNLISSSQEGWAEEIAKDPHGNDFFVILSPPDSDLPTILTGKNGETMKTVSHDVQNGRGKVELWFEKKNGRYYFKYKTERYSYPNGYVTVEEFQPKEGSRIIIKAISDEDEATPANIGALVDVYNNTDLPVDVILTGKTKNYDRIKINTKSGIVRTYFR